MVIINIGLHRNDGGMVDVARLLRGGMLDRLITKAHVYVSDTEPTLVACLACDAQRAQLVADIVCANHAQDAVAFWDAATNAGHLVGPKAEAWGPFNPAYFIMMDGRRMMNHRLSGV